MNREQALNDLDTYKYTSYKSSDPLGKWEDVRYGNAKALINEIYDSFESRTCSTCKHLTGKDECYIIDNHIYPDYDVLDDSGFQIQCYNIEKPTEFGCNKWQPMGDIK